jgi:hypothetical protein
MSVDTNPCRRNAFDAFAVGRSEIVIRNVRRAIKKARGDWKDNGGTLIARDATPWTLTEAQLNSLEEELLDPLRRLQLEELVHEEHLFAADVEIRELADALIAALERSAGASDVLEQVRGELVGRLRRLLPPLPVPALADDLPWPPAPPAYPVALEPFDAVIRRER